MFRWLSHCLQGISYNFPFSVLSHDFSIFSYICCFYMFQWFSHMFPCFSHIFLWFSRVLPMIFYVCLPWFSKCFPLFSYIFSYDYISLYDFPICFPYLPVFPPIFPNLPRHPSRAVLRRQVRQALHLLCQVLQLLCVARRLPGGKTVGRSIGITVGKTLVGSWLYYGYYMMAI